MLRVIRFFLLLLAANLGAEEKTFLNEPAVPGTLSYELLYKRRYHEWMAAAYADRSIAISSNYLKFTEMPEFKAIVQMGEGILPYLVQDIRDRVDGFYYLHYAIIEIKGWAARELVDYVGSDYPQKALSRLAAEDKDIKEILERRRINKK